MTNQIVAFHNFCEKHLIKWTENSEEEVKATEARNYVGNCTWWQDCGGWHIDESCLAKFQGILTTAAAAARAAVGYTVGHCRSLLSSLLCASVRTYSDLTYGAVRLLPLPHNPSLTLPTRLPWTFAEKPVTKQRYVASCSSRQSRKYKSIPGTPH